MRRPLIALAATLALAVPASAAATTSPPQAMQARWMGPMTCGAWRNAGNLDTSREKAMMLNWILGFLNGRSSIRGDNLLATVEIDSVAAWIDDFCGNEPLELLTKAAFDLEVELIARRRT